MHAQRFLQVRLRTTNDSARIRRPIERNGRSDGDDGHLACVRNAGRPDLGTRCDVDAPHAVWLEISSLNCPLAILQFG